MEIKRDWWGGDGLEKEIEAKIHTCEKAEECREQYRQSDSQQKDGFSFSLNPSRSDAKTWQ